MTNLKDILRRGGLWSGVFMAIALLLSAFLWIKLPANTQVSIHIASSDEMIGKPWVALIPVWYLLISDAVFLYCAYIGKKKHPSPNAADLDRIYAHIWIFSQAMCLLAAAASIPSLLGH